MDKYRKTSMYLILVAIGILMLVRPSIVRQRYVKSSKDKAIEVQNNIKSGKTGQLLEIPKIDLLLPIEHGATHENMKDGVATMTNHSVRHNTNFTLAGHRNIRYGHNFNRLNEVIEGDIVKVYQDGEVFTFRIKEKKVVEPKDVDVLEDRSIGEITLITCYPISVSTHRLVLKGEMI